MATREPIPADVLRKVRHVLDVIRTREEGLRVVQKAEAQPPPTKKEPPKTP
jgi:hypothetical protein